MVDPAPRPWQQVIAAAICAPHPMSERLRRHPTARMKNMEEGIRADFGRGAGHTWLARWILANIGGSCVVVPSDRPPHPDLQRYPEELRRFVWVSRPAEGAELADVVEKKFPPLAGSRICVVDGASRLSVAELEALRAAEWHRYVELG